MLKCSVIVYMNDNAVNLRARQKQVLEIRDTKLVQIFGCIRGVGSKLRARFFSGILFRHLFGRLRKKKRSLFSVWCWSDKSGRRKGEKDREREIDKRTYRFAMKINVRCERGHLMIIGRYSAHVKVVT